MVTFQSVKFKSTRTSESDTITLDIFPDCAPFESNAYRTTSEEKRYIERNILEDPEETYENIRRAAEVHRLVRKHARKYIRPGMSMTEIAENIEDGTRALVEENGLECGVGFPTGVSLNECAAHYTPNAGDTRSTLFRHLHRLRSSKPSIWQLFKKATSWKLISAFTCMARFWIQHSHSHLKTLTTSYWKQWKLPLTLGSEWEILIINVVQNNESSCRKLASTSGWVI